MFYNMKNKKYQYRGRLTRGIVAKQSAIHITGESYAKRAIGASPEDITLKAGQELDIVEVRTDGTIVAISPINPEEFITIAREFVEIYNEAVGLWQTVAAFFKRVGAAFKTAWQRLTGKNKPQ